MVSSAHTHPTFELFDAVPLLAKTVARERKLGPCPEIPYCLEVPSLTLLKDLVIRSRQFPCIHPQNAPSLALHSLTFSASPVYICSKL